MANLTTKELSALEDQIGYEQTLVKKYEAMACLCNDIKIQQDFNNYANKHRAHYNTLVSFLQ
jgi:rubrerythrin